MIGYIEGKVLHQEDRALIVTTGGVGYALFVTPATTTPSAVGKTIGLWTHLSVKENALELYGFPRREELALFRLLINISGIGPKSALNILSLADHETLVRAIRRGDGAYLTKVSGIGKKLAEKIVLELKEKVGEVKGGDEISQAESEALLALESLGYDPRDTRTVIRALAKDTKQYPTAQTIIRKALQTLGGR
ncbi:MAG: Holliday junction DNA helicase RuvA [Candidatus Lloydbacteria bacterium RIFCSPHIGHO2_02_FULL_50_13]|uniref:Holliday junction branch migration complex subunit RuvA n=1 Tax=Candidatus Lloydbacteria bacterium RIFCSPHIGHO2_02_FULL_50_13 TaxID=1798661 RepID=A0A1G2D545_9BACT|nr:MAG: Holliday junction DNA helicase RuvA [Candidatus Lloydbacteria bacterium RIFCSPHIGHO2_02_FULL_50_13]